MAVKSKLDTNLAVQKTKDGLVVKGPSRQSYLITFYTPRQGKSIVLLQASHNSTSLRFPDLESTFHYLEELNHGNFRSN